ncbi:glutathione S-transferase [Xanthomonas translucens pv. arrhenatheri]|uniref:Glutathione S-transferase n=2 Tax=Xanthomonas graminis TaxID=3390026 RepID=A0A0K2ZKL2_9XANT|nr:glutathione S-transferase family protein [Xanthomonas translucens]OAX64775.1 glutathione S-transferase [Xanthomonas translucens pv. arrhenatheri]UKE60870.1 glutathione S-transferase family protein [Xanthomonas translucens pv. poae]UKE79041.1 glutathione S-transferase family protein [Xanthomonas translucens pv. arrhenatheri]CTP83930.1 glutathione S-transferase [Xanthomonas translucens pv. arrhenatheri LMG 727]CTP84225.1 glutathione S-transferase [Xanthomonas translucens pv. poae]
MPIADRHVTLYHNPKSRSKGVLILLEELGADYALQRIDFASGAQLEPEYLAINPMGKVPAIDHAGAVVTEQVAIYQYLADLYPEAGLAPAMGDPRRGPYLRWLAFYGSAFEPAVIDRALKREAPPRAMSPYADCDTVMGVVDDQLARGDYLLGAQCTAADVLWGSALGWMIGFGLVDPPAPTRAYVERMAARPAVQRAQAIDAAAEA